MELLFYFQLAKLSAEYLQFNKITNIEYKRKFVQDNLFISLVLEIREPNLKYIQNYYGIENNRKKYKNIKYNDSTVFKCSSSEILSFSLNKLFENEQDNFDNDVLATIQLMCNNISFKHIMDKYFFYYN